MKLTNELMLLSDTNKGVVMLSTGTVAYKWINGARSI